MQIEPYFETGYLQGHPEVGVQEVLLEYLRPGSCFFDVGANIGYYTLLAAHLVGPTGTVVAFEPDPDNLALLQKNLTRNNCVNVSIIPAAVWNYDGAVTFNRSPDPSRALGHIVGTGIADALVDSSLSCTAITLDTAHLSYNSPTVIKIDAEGAELEVLQGSMQVLRQHMPVLVIEIQPKNLSAVSELLATLNYTIRPLEAQTSEGSANYIAISK